MNLSLSSGLLVINPESNGPFSLARFMRMPKAVWKVERQLANRQMLLKSPQLLHLTRTRGGFPGPGNG